MRAQDLNFGSLFESMREAVIVAEAATGRIVLWNPMASEVFGYSPAEALGMNVEELVPAGLHATYRAEVSRYREIGHGPYADSGTVLELPAVQKGGQEIRIELTLSPTEASRDAGSREHFMLAVVRDVTVRRRRAEDEVRRLSEEYESRLSQRTTELEAAGAELRDSEERYRLLVESLRDYAIFLVGADGRIANWNVGAERIFGYREEEILGKGFPILFTSENARRGIPQRKLRKALAEGRAEDECWHVRKDGSRFWASDIVTPTRDEAGKLLGFTKVTRDLTERRRAEEASRESYALLNSIIEGTGEAIFLKDSQGRYVMVNSAAVEIVGRPAEEILGKKDADLYPSEVADSLVEVDRRVMDTGETITLEESLPVAGATRTYLTTKSPYRDHQGNVGGIIGVSTDITERKRAEEELADQKILLETILNQAAHGIVVHDAQGRFAFINAAARQMALTDPEGTTLEIAPEVWGVAYHPEGRRMPLEEWPTSRALRGETTVGTEMRMVRPDGSHYDLLVSAAPLLNREAQTVGAVASFQNITERKRVEERLREAERRYRTLVEQIPAITYIQEPGEPSRTTYISPQYEKILGHSSQESLSDPEHWIKIMHPADRERVLDEDRRTNETGEPFSMEYRQFAKDGRVVWIRDEATLVRDEDGNPSYWLGVQVDVTERKGTEHALKESEERFRQLFEQSVDALFVHDEKGRFIDCNSQACRLLGYSREELLSLSVKDISCNLLTEEERALKEMEGGTLWQRALAGAPGVFALSHEEENRRKDGSVFPVEVRVGSVDYGGRRMILASTRDITERKRTEEALQESHGRIRNIIESITEGFFAVDREWRYTYINERALRSVQKAHGEELTREDLLGKNVWELFPETVGSIFSWKYHEAMREQKTVQFEAYSQRTDMWFEVHVYPSEEGLAVYSRDITDRKRTEKEIETRTHQQAVVAELGRQALAETDLQALMDEAASLVVRTLEVEYCKILELLPERDELLLRAGIGWEEGLVGRATEGTGLGSQAGFTLLSGEPVIVEDLREERRFSASALLRDHGAVSGMSVIIEGRGRPFGILGAHTKRRRTFTGDDINFLQAVANVLATAIERVQVEEMLSEIRETERSRLARDLHDDAFQDLTRALVETQLLQQISEYSELNQRLHRVGEALKRVGQGMRGAIYDLRLEGEAREQTFVEMLESLVELNRRSSPDCKIELSVEDGVPPTLSRTQQVELLRAMREALTNALRHSGADRIRIAIGASGVKLWAEVEDNGRGFDPTKRGVAGMGIQGMRERVSALGGDLRIVSKPGEGTKVRFELVLNRDQEEPEEVRILLVDDHASFRQAMAAVFEREPGFRIAGEAGSLTEARQVLDGVDVAVVDLRLPDGYGGELIQELRAHNPRAQALVLSAILDRAEIARAVECGAAGVLDKSTGMDEVVEAVRRLRAGETLLPLEEIVELLRFASSRREEEYEARQALARLTSRERELLQALAEGLDSREIAERLHISVKTEANHMTSILSKLGLHSRLQALVFAVRHGIVEIH